MKQFCGSVVSVLIVSCFISAPGRALEVLARNGANTDVLAARAASRFLGKITTDKYGVRDSRLAQSFRLRRSAEIRAVELFVLPGHDCVTGIDVAIQTDSDNAPGGSLVTPNAHGTADGVRTAGAWRRFNLARPVPVAAERRYWLVFSKPVEDAPNRQFLVPATLVDEQGPRDWYLPGRAAEVYCKMSDEGKPADPAPKDWHVMVSHDFPFAIHGEWTSPTRAARAAFGRPVITTLGTEIRRNEGLQLDIPAMIDALKKLHVNTYLYLLWHSPMDWHDLPGFCDAAAEADIDVFVYTVPPSETPFNGMELWNEPFRLDYKRWAREIAMLGLEHPNLRGLVIDDFAQNQWTFTPEYVREMIDGAREINPDFLFCPLLYFRFVTPEWVRTYGDVVDAAMVAYPTGVDDIRRAHAVFTGTLYKEPTVVFEYPWGETPPTKEGLPSTATPLVSAKGDAIWVRMAGSVTDGAGARLSIDVRDTYNGTLSGFLRKEILVNDKAVWSRDVAEDGTDWETVSIDLSALLGGSDVFDLALRATVTEALSIFNARVEWRNLSGEGIDLEGGLGAGKFLDEASPETWTVRREPREAHRFTIPFIVMISGPNYMYKERWGKEPSVENEAKLIRMVTDEMEAGYADGIAIYRFRMNEDPYLERIGGIFKEVGERLAGRKVPHGPVKEKGE